MRVKGQSLLAAPSRARTQGSDLSRATSSRAPCRKSRGSIPPCCVRRGPQGIVPITRSPLPPPRPRAGPQAGSASWPVGPQQCVPHPAGGAGSLRRLRSPDPDVTARGRHGDGLTGARVRASSLLATARSPLPLYRHWAARRSGVKATSMGCAGRGGRGGAGPERGGAGRGVAACGRRRRGADMRRGPGGGSSVGGGGAKGRRRSRASSRTGGVPGRAHGGRQR